MMADGNEDEVPRPESPPELQFVPVVHLKPVETKTLEEEEDVLLKLRGRLFRFTSEAVPAEWKECGTGVVKILQHKVSGMIRILMRRDKTLKISANHYITPLMQLKPNCGSDRAWVWSTVADFADEEAKEQLLAIRFADAENAQKFKTVFEESQAKVELAKKSDDEEEEEEEEEEDGEEQKSSGDTASPKADDKEREDKLAGDKLGHPTVKDSAGGDTGTTLLDKEMPPPDKKETDKAAEETD